MSVKIIKLTLLFLMRSNYQSSDSTLIELDNLTICIYRLFLVDLKLMGRELL